MDWRLSSWLVLVRVFQLLATFIAGAMNGWLTYYIYTNHLGLSQFMIILEILVGAVFLYTVATIAVLHTGWRSQRPSWLACVICLDIAFAIVSLAIISILAYSGLPDNCGGLTRSDYVKGDKLPIPAALPRGYTTIRFSDEQDGHRGLLDRYCGMERAFYFVAIACIITYMLNIVLGLLSIWQTRYTKNSEVQQMLDERENMIRQELKLQESPPSASSFTPTPASPALGPKPNNADEEAALFLPAISGSSRPGPALPLAPRPMLPEPDVSPYLAGPSSFPGAGPSQRLSFTSSAPTAVGSSTAGGPGAGPSSPRLSLLSNSEVHANMAMITDGSRYNPSDGDPVLGGLPPYSPGNMRRMNGHGDESNDIRLSEYVKGGTRAQDMKDSGRY